MRKIIITFSPRNVGNWITENYAEFLAHCTEANKPPHRAPPQQVMPDTEIHTSNDCGKKITHTFNTFDL